jgi:hypothetical protein
MTITLLSVQQGLHRRLLLVGVVVGAPLQTASLPVATLQPVPSSLTHGPLRTLLIRNFPINLTRCETMPTRQ